MDRNIHPFAAFVVILTSVVVLGVWYFCTGKAKESGGPAGLVVNPDGHLFIQIQNQLLEHDAVGNFVARHDLAAFGVDHLLGGTAFFSNGDILLRRGPDTRSLSDTVRAYRRKTNNKSISPDAPDTGLYRCDLDSKRCVVFGSAPIDFKSAFSVHIDRATDEVYFSDSSRHVVRKYTGDGREAAAPAAGFKFPNQLMVHEGRLLVADTNHHRIRAVRPDSESFGRERYGADVVPRDAAANGHEWPSHFVRVGDEWWVNNMKTGMDYGGVYAFDETWTFVREVPLPKKADPIALVAFAGEVLVSDWYGDRVHRLSADGELLGDFQSAGLNAVLEESRARRNLFTLYAWIAVAIGLVLIVITVIKGSERRS